MTMRIKIIFVWRIYFHGQYIKNRIYLKNKIDFLDSNLKKIKHSAISCGMLCDRDKWGDKKKIGGYVNLSSFQLLSDSKNQKKAKIQFFKKI